MSAEQLPPTPMNRNLTDSVKRFGGRLGNARLKSLPCPRSGGSIGPVSALGLSPPGCGPIGIGRASQRWIPLVQHLHWGGCRQNGRKIIFF